MDTTTHRGETPKGEYAQHESAQGGGASGTGRGGDVRADAAQDSEPLTEALVDVPDGPNTEWVGVWRLPLDQRRWLMDAVGKWHPVITDACGNWCAQQGEPRVYARDGGLFYPADDPLGILDLLAADPSLEAMILRLAAEKIEGGKPLSLEDEARVTLAQQRLREVAA